MDIEPLNRDELIELDFIVRAYGNSLMINDPGFFRALENLQAKLQGLARIAPRT
jgi:hypothetical protein